ncbi:MAG: ABC transporter permease [Patescibacteria group bacterium]|nr:ABC transporter permease [Patescibacteria group bacterium]
MDLFLWGLTGLYFAGLNKNPYGIDIILNGVVFWLIVWRAQYEISINLLSELWDKNMVNIFASPLKVGEWILSVIIFGLLKMIVSFIFVSIISFALYKYNIFLYGFYLIPIIISLLLTGWTIGFIVSGFLIRYGQKIQTIAWAGGAIIAPLSAIYFPLSVLPYWAQKAALIVPSSYIFEGMRQILFTGNISYDKLLISFLLNFIYLSFSIMFFVFMFKKSRKLGLGRLI